MRYEPFDRAPNKLFIFLFSTLIMEMLSSIKIEEKKHPNALAYNEKETLKEILNKTGFKREKEIFRGEIIYTKGAKPVTGSILLKGTYKAKPAVLKIQGLRLESSEVEIIKRFEQQNKSRIIHAPTIYQSEEWNAKRGYGFFIMEFVNAPHIYSLPFATSAQMKDFSRFYQEYKTKAITKPWIKLETSNIYSNAQLNDASPLSAVINAVEKWRKNAEAKGRLRFEDYAPYLIRFYPIAARYVPVMKIEFMHRELTQQHIFKLDDGTYKLFSNILWGYRLQWSDLAYNIWFNLLNIKGNSYTADEVIDYTEKWVNIYKMMPIVKRDENFEQKMNFLLTERAIGIIVGDLGSGQYWGSSEGKKYFKHMLRIYQRVFNHFAEKL